MTYLNGITFKKDFRNLKKGFKVTFENVTLLVGDQGSGKSTLLTLMQKYDKETLKFDLSNEGRGISTFYFDTESMNPRIGHMDDYSTPNGSSKGIGIGGFIQSKFQSHGEVMEIFTIEMMTKAKDCVLFVDEPESGLSLKNQYLLIKSIEKAAKRDTQLVIATHCLPLINHYENVFDMIAGKWMGSKDYVKQFQE